MTSTEERLRIAEEKLAEAEVEVRKLKRVKQSVLSQIALENTQVDLLDTRYIKWVNFLMKEFSRAKISVTGLREYQSELENESVKERHPILFEVTIAKICIVFIGENHYSNMRFQISRYNFGSFYNTFSLHREQYSNDEGEYYGFEKKPIPRFMSKTLKFKDTDELMFYVPFYADIFYGLLRSTITAYLVNAKEEDTGLIGLEELNRFWK